MKPIEEKIKDEDFLKSLAGALKKSPNRIKRELKYKHNRFKTQIAYVEATNKIEWENYSIKDLFFEKIKEND